MLPARYSVLGATLLVSLSGVLAAQAVPSPKKSTPRKSAATGKRTGEQVYVQQCAACHGPKGEGTKAYAKPLIGDQTISQLARFISQAMPPGKAKKCSVPDSQLVAAYIYDAFYSPVAQARNRPARLELSRLTVRQYRNAVADLVGSFRQSGKWDDRRGLRGEYYKSRRIRNGEKLMDRVDPEIRFDWGQQGPVPEQSDPHQFSIRWDGSVIAPDTGEYEFIVRTEHATRLWVNDLGQPLIDAFVKSGSDNVYRGAVHLVAGRAYPVRLEFSKANQGVDDSDKLKDRPVAKASLSLEWKRPKLAPEVISQRYLMPALSPESFVVTSPFPPDDRSEGYEKGTSVSKAWEEATTEAAIETAGYIAGHLRELTGAPENDPNRSAKLKEFCRQFATRAFRRPLTPEVQQAFIDRQFEAAPDLDTAVKRVVLLTLKSPRFLYREVGSATPDPYDVASRLSFALWDSLPDAELLKAAAAGELTTREQVAKQAERMVADPRSRAKLREFFLQWLKVDHNPELAKDAKRFPGFDEKVAADLRTSLELTLEQVMWSERSDYRELLLADKVYLNGRLAKFYGVDLPADAPFQLVALDPKERSGVITHPYVLAAFAYLDESSPIHRGVMIARSLFGRRLQPPAQAFTPLPAELHPNLTTRQRVALQTKPTACSTCHDLINPLGFTLEKFDAIGRLRAQENGKPVDATGEYEPRSGKAVKFAGARDLATYLTVSDEAHVAFVEQLFQHLVKQPAQAFGPDTLSQMQKSFASHDFNIRSQIVETAVVAARLKQ